MTEMSSESKDVTARSSRRNPLANRNFRLMWLGESISLIGDQFYNIGLPWLVLARTGSLLALGTILLVGGIPRSVFMLVGGAIVDRTSPRSVMLVSNLARLGITLILMLLVIIHTDELWMLYAISFGFGLVSAFFQPAAFAIIPALTNEDELAGSNALMQGATMVAQAIGPGLAGLLVNALGVAIAFGVDAFTFLFTFFTLSMIDQPALAAKKSTVRGNIFREIGEMLHAVGSDPILAPMMQLAVAVNLFATGTTIIGAAALAKLRFISGGPIAYGAMLSSFGIGLMSGLVAGGFLRPQKLGVILLTSIAVVGAGIASLAIAPTLAVACGSMLIVGLLQGFLGVLLFSWIQRRVAREMMGRVMSVLGLASVGLSPISIAIAGAVANWSIPLKFLVSGTLLTIVAGILAATRPALRSLRAGS